VNTYYIDCETSATARPSTPDATRIIISVPASELGQEVKITMSPRKAGSAVALPTSTKLPEKLNLPRATAGDTQPFLILDITEEPPKALVEYAVPLDTLLRFPPKEPDALNTGWKRKCWYVVPLGTRPGIYYDFW
jgi:hypothetical protein